MARVSAAEIETAVIKALPALSAIPEAAEAVRDPQQALVDQHLQRVTVRMGRLDIRARNAEANASQTISVPWSSTTRSRKQQILLPAASGDASQHAIGSEPRASFLEAIAKARQWLHQLTSQQVSDTKEIATRERCSERSVRMTLSLAFLSPTIIRAAIDGTLPHRITLAPFTQSLPDWELQREIFGENAPG